MTASSKHYHIRTGYDRHRMTGHGLDWTNRPGVYKRYPEAAPIELPRGVRLPELKLSEVLKKPFAGADMPLTVSMEDLSAIFLLTYSLTAKSGHSGGEVYYRSVASAGALYPAEIYVSLRNISGLKNGLYHFSIADHGLCLLREENSPRSNPPAMTFFCSAIFFRSAWKYRDRSYRYHLLDTGHLVEHLVLAFRALGLPYLLTYDFDDRRVNRFLGFDEEKEVALSVCHAPKTPSFEMKPETIGKLPEAMRQTSLVSPAETDYPAIREIHRAGEKMMLQSRPAPPMAEELGLTCETRHEVETPGAWPETMSYSESVFSRRSKRNFIRKPLSRDAMAALLDALCTPDPENSVAPEFCERSFGAGFITDRVDGFDPGFYLLDPSASCYGLVKPGNAPGNTIDQMAHICLDQAWLANGSVHFVFMANLKQLDRRWGARGYRYAMMTAGRMGERLYLCATALGIGCCGIGAFYDLEASQLLGLNAESRLLYLVAVGQVKK